VGFWRCLFFQQQYTLLVYICVQSGAIARLLRPAVEWYATRYQASLAVNLKKYGLRYDDLYDPAMDLVRGREGGVQAAPGGFRARSKRQGMTVAAAYGKVLLG
jgi:hypothetical protein